jgi:hypothetical protein
LEILEKDRSDKVPGHYRIRIDGNQTISYGVSVLMNNHIVLDSNKKSDVNEVVRAIEDNWKDAATKAESYLERIGNKLDV